MYLALLPPDSIRRMSAQSNYGTHRSERKPEGFFAFVARIFRKPWRS